MRAHVHIGHVEYNVMSPSAFGVMCHPPLSTRVPNQVPKPSESSVVWTSSYLRHFQRRGDGLARVCWRCRRLRLQKEKARELACLSPTWHSTFIRTSLLLVGEGNTIQESPSELWRDLETSTVATEGLEVTDDLCLTSICNLELSRVNDKATWVLWPVVRGLKIRGWIIVETLSTPLPGPPP